MRHRRFACARLPDPYMTRSQPRLLTMTFTTAAFDRSSSGQSPPARRPRCLHLSHSTTPARLLDTTPPQPFGLKQLTAVWSLLLQAGSEGPSFISGTAPCSVNTFLAQQTRGIFETLKFQ